MSQVTGDQVRLYALADLALLVARLIEPSSAAEGDAPITSDDLRALAEATGFQTPDALVAALGASLDANRSIDPATWRGEHTRLFEGGVACPINETAFVRRDKGQIIADICAFYRAFGVEPRWGSGEKPDHLVGELEFVAVLLVMLAQARGRPGRAEAAQVTEEALRSFLLDHLGEWLPLFCARLVAASSLALYVCHAASLAAAWDAIAQAFALPSLEALATSFDVEEASADHESGLDETPYECDMVEDDAASFVPLTRGGR